METRDITPDKFKCDFEGSCPSVHETESGDIIFIGDYVSQGELATMGIKSRSDGESAVRYHKEFVDAFMLEWAAKKSQGK